jgi:hypothetical protein
MALADSTARKQAACVYLRGSADRALEDSVAFMGEDSGAIRAPKWKSRTPPLQRKAIRLFRAR